MNHHYSDDLEQAALNNNIDVLMRYSKKILTIVESNDPQAIAELLETLENSYGYQSRVIIQTLPLIPELEPVLIRFLQRGYEFPGPSGGMPHLDAVMKLANFKTPTAAIAIRNWVSGVLQLDENKRFYASEGIMSLARMDDKNSLPLIRTCLNDDNADIRSAAIAAVGILKDNESVPKLIGLLSDRAENPGVSEELICDATARALGAIGDTRAIQPIENMIEQRRTGMHPIKAICALIQLGDEGFEAVRALRNRIDDDLKTEIDRGLKLEGRNHE